MRRAKVSLPTQTKLSLPEEALRIDVFWEALKGHSLQNVTTAFEGAFKELKWFPTPSDILDSICETARLNHHQELESQRLEWMEPTEKGRQHAKDIISAMFAKWDEEDRREKAARDEKFENNRARVKKHAQFFLKTVS